MIIFPDISPIALQLGPISIHWYGLGYVVGLLLAWTFSRRLVSNASLWRPHPSPITSTDIDDIIMWMIFGIILGGRLGYVLFYNFDFYLTQPLQIFAIWDGGMSFHGGTLGVALSALIFSHKRGISPYSMLDIITVSSCFGLFLVRLTNFINSELWGKPTDLPWGVLFPNGGFHPRHPSQLYEAALEGIVLFLILYVFHLPPRQTDNPRFHRRRMALPLCPSQNIHRVCPRA